MYIALIVSIAVVVIAWRFMVSMVTESRLDHEYRIAQMSQEDARAAHREYVELKGLDSPEFLSVRRAEAEAETAKAVARSDKEKKEEAQIRSREYERAYRR